MGNDGRPCFIEYVHPLAKRTPVAVPTTEPRTLIQERNRAHIIPPYFEVKVSEFLGEGVVSRYCEDVDSADEYPSAASFLFAILVRVEKSNGMHERSWARSLYLVLLIIPREDRVVPVT